MVPQARERCQSAHYLSEHHNAAPPPANSSGWTSVWTLKRIIGMSPECVWGGVLTPEATHKSFVTPASRESRDGERNCLPPQKERGREGGREGEEERTPASPRGGHN